jgi:trimeric autotransporter adhesin
LSDFAVEMGFARPVVTGAAVTTEMVPGLNAQYVGGRSAEELSSANDQRLRGLEAAVSALSGRVDNLESANTALTARVSDLEGANTELQARLTGVSRVAVGGRDTLRFSGMNLQVVSGTGATDGTPNGLGNVIIGYNAQRDPAAERSGSHTLVVGDQHEWTSFGGLLAGFHNTASGDWASVSGGGFNHASGTYASVSGGSANRASGNQASVLGGFNSTASGEWQCHPACVVED